MKKETGTGLGGWLNYGLWMALAITIVGLDQLTKLAIIRWVPLYDKIPLNSFINITHHRNTGAAFSFLADAGGWQRWFFTGLAGVVSVVLVVWIYRLRDEGQWLLSAGLALVPLALAGAKPGAELEAPMAVVILFGLLTATALNMIVVPVAYLKFGRRTRQIRGTI